MSVSEIRRHTTIPQSNNTRAQGRRVTNEGRRDPCTLFNAALLVCGYWTGFSLWYGLTYTKHFEKTRSVALELEHSPYVQKRIYFHSPYEASSFNPPSYISEEPFFEIRQDIMPLSMENVNTLPLGGNYVYCLTNENWHRKGATPQDCAPEDVFVGRTIHQPHPPSFPINVLEGTYAPKTEWITSITEIKSIPSNVHILKTTYQNETDRSQVGDPAHLKARYTFYDTNTHLWEEYEGGQVKRAVEEHLDFSALCEKHDTALLCKSKDIRTFLTPEEWKFKEKDVLVISQLVDTWQIYRNETYDSWTLHQQEGPFEGDCDDAALKKVYHLVKTGWLPLHTTRLTKFISEGVAHLGVSIETRNNKNEPVYYALFGGEEDKIKTLEKDTQGRLFYNDQGEKWYVDWMQSPVEPRRFERLLPSTSLNETNVTFHT